MPGIWRGALALAVGSLIATCSGTMTNAYASTTSTTSTDSSIHKHHAVHKFQTGGGDSGAPKHSSKSGKARYASAGGLQCVPFARAASGIALKGNAVNWWDAAAGVYERGSRPEPGSVLNFRATGRMRLGHVAVVTNVIGERELEIDHANWSGLGASKGGVSRGIRVIDVSQNNDWTQVRVALGHSEDFGSVYPTYGFIYDRPDNGRIIANAPMPDLSPVGDRALMNEVAEAPERRTVLPVGLTLDAADHSVR
jgi:surface antigen